jgi:hypothetical protein
MGHLGFFSNVILLATLWSWSQLQPQTEMNTSGILERGFVVVVVVVVVGKYRQCIGLLATLHPSRVDGLEILGDSTS